MRWEGTSKWQPVQHSLYVANANVFDYTRRKKRYAFHKIHKHHKMCCSLQFDIYQRAVWMYSGCIYLYIHTLYVQCNTLLMYVDGHITYAYAHEKRKITHTHTHTIYNRWWTHRDAHMNTLQPPVYLSVGVHIYMVRHSTVRPHNYIYIFTSLARSRSLSLSTILAL